MQKVRVTYSEWLAGGVMVHFDDDRSVFFSSQFLCDHREEQLTVFAEDVADVPVRKLIP